MGIDAACFRNSDAVGITIGNFANEMSSLYVSQDDPTLFADEAIADAAKRVSGSLAKCLGIAA